jgi:hypothetical protein
MPPKKPQPQTTPLYVKIPTTAADKLDRAAAELGVHKKDLVAHLLDRYVAQSSRRPASAEQGPMMGTYSFQPYDPPEVMNAEQAGQFLQIETHIVIELAEAGKLPGKKLGPAWRFSREALVTWLSTPEVSKR